MAARVVCNCGALIRLGYGDAPVDYELPMAVGPFPCPSCGRAHSVQVASFTLNPTGDIPVDPHDPFLQTLEQRITK